MLADVLAMTYYPLLKGVTLHPLLIEVNLGELELEFLVLSLWDLVALFPREGFELVEELSLEQSLVAPDGDKLVLPVIVLLVLAEVVYDPEELLEVGLKLIGGEDMHHLIIITELILLIIGLGEGDVIRVRVFAVADICLFGEMFQQLSLRGLISTDRWVLISSFDLFLLHCSRTLSGIRLSLVNDHFLHLDDRVLLILLRLGLLFTTSVTHCSANIIVGSLWNLVLYIRNSIIL